jgi:KaiC/GvpD/RAD55 family RecA-like ATPase
MKGENSCEICGAPIDTVSSVCATCDNPYSKKGRGGKTSGRFSLARVFSSTRRRATANEDAMNERSPREALLERESRFSSNRPLPSDHEDDYRTPTAQTRGLDFDGAEKRFKAFDDTTAVGPNSPVEPEDMSEDEDMADDEVDEGGRKMEALDAILTDISSDEEEEEQEHDEHRVGARAAVPVMKVKVRSGEPLEKIKTYVDGFDEALSGGIPENHIVLLSGAAGAMKSTLAYYILYMNILANGTKCLYVTLEQTLQSLLNQMNAMGMDSGDVESSLRMFDMGFIRKHMRRTKRNWFKLFMSNVTNVKKQRGFDIMVIDSLEALEVLAEFGNRRGDMFHLFEWLRSLDITTFIITERSDCPFGRHLSHLRNEEEFLADGIISLALHSISETDVQRRIRCVKMRGTGHEDSYLSLMWDDGKFRVTKAVGR